MNKRLRVWIVVDTRYIELECSKYIKNIRVLEGDDGGVVYTSPDGVLKVYVFNN